MQWFSDSGYDCYAIDLDRGKGATIESYVSQLRRAVEQLTKEPYLIGHSMGGFVVQKYLEHYSCRGAVLLASVPPNGALNAAMRFLTKHPTEIVNLFKQDLLRIFVRHWRVLFRPGTSKGSIDPFLQQMVPESFRAFLSMIFRPVKRGRYGSTPILVMGSHQDRLISPREVAATARYYGTAPKVLEGVGHLMMLEVPQQELVDVIHAWLQAQD